MKNFEKEDVKLSKREINEKLNSLIGVLPFTLINELKSRLSNIDVTESQFNKIMGKTIISFHSKTTMFDELTVRIEELEETVEILRNIIEEKDREIRKLKDYVDDELRKLYEKLYEEISEIKEDLRLLIKEKVDINSIIVDVLEDRI